MAAVCAAEEPPQSVSKPAGSIMETWIPKPLTSAASDSLNPSTANFEAAYNPNTGRLINPSTLES